MAANEPGAVGESSGPAATRRGRPTRQTVLVLSVQPALAVRTVRLELAVRPL